MLLIVAWFWIERILCCVDVDECENDPCPPFQHCIDNIGSYDCNSYYPTPRPCKLLSICIRQHTCTHSHIRTHTHTHKQAHTLKHNTRTYNVTLHRLKCAYPLVITITMAIMVIVVINIAPTTSMMIMTVVVIKAATMMTIIFLSSASSSLGPTSREWYSVTHSP